MSEIMEWFRYVLGMDLRYARNASRRGNLGFCWYEALDPQDGPSWWKDRL